MLEVVPSTWKCLFWKECTLPLGREGRNLPESCRWPVPVVGVWRKAGVLVSKVGMLVS